MQLVGFYTPPVNTTKRRNAIIERERETVRCQSEGWSRRRSEVGFSITEMRADGLFEWLSGPEFIPALCG